MRSRLAAILIPGLAWLLASVAWCPGAVADDRTDQMLRLLRRRPEGMDASTWKTQRREAVRELGRRRVRRAVPRLLQIVARERFDVILEFAITALGEIRDRRAVPALERLKQDSSLDSYVREAAARSLRKIGTGTSPRVTPRPKKTDRPTRPRPRKVPRPVPPGPKKDPPRPAQVRWTHDPTRGFEPVPGPGPRPAAAVLQRSSWWDLAASSARVNWDGQVQGTSAGFKLGSRYTLHEERDWFGFSLRGVTHLGFQLQRPPGGASSWELTHALELRPEVRFYPFTRSLPLLFAQLGGGAGYGLVQATSPTADDRLSVAGNLSVGAGPGYGRLLDVGPRLRLRRLEHTLARARMLHNSISARVAEELFHVWYGLRNRVGSFARLGQTLRILQRAGLLRNRPLGPALTYRLIRILDDPQLDDRPEGYLFRLGYGYARTLIKDADDTNLAFVYATGEYHRQFGALHGFAGDLRFFYQMVGDPDFYGVTFSASYLRHLYTTSIDPVGSIGAGIKGGLSNQPGAALADGGLGYRFVANASYTHHFSRGTSVAASVGAGVDTGSPLLLFSLQARYGLARGSYVTSTR